MSEEILETRHPVMGSSGWSFHQQVLQRVGRHVGVDVADFREINHTSRSLEASRTILQPQPLYVSTAKEIGVISNPNVPSLVSCLLPPTAATSSAKYLQKLLVSPPPPHISEHFRSMLQGLSDLDLSSLPKMTTIAIGKVVSLLSASRCKRSFISRNGSKYEERDDSALSLLRSGCSLVKRSSSVGCLRERSADDRPFRFYFPTRRFDQNYFPIDHLASRPRGPSSD